MSDTSIPRRSERARAICAANWRTDRTGRPAADCCGACPIRRECSAMHPLTYTDLRSYIETINAAAEAVAK